MSTLTAPSKCEEQVTYGGVGNSHRCVFKSKYLVTRSDGDTKWVCGTHANQAKRYGWTLVKGIRAI